MVAAFKKAGFSVERTEGSHVIMVKKGIARPLVIPAYDEIPDFIVSNNLRTAGISRKKYLDLLSKRKGKKQKNC